MSLPPFNFQTVFLGMSVWLLIGILIGLVICKAMHIADAKEGTTDGQADAAEADDDDDSTWLDDAPTDVLSAAEIDRRIERLESQLRHPSSREWGRF